MTQSQPPITRTTHTLPFDKLSPRDFERLCLWLVEREGYERAEHLGAAGSEQGHDIVAWCEGALWAFQCKRVRSFGPRDTLAEVEKVLALPEAKHPGGLVFLVTCDVSAKTRQQARERCAGEMECHFWAGTELDEKVKQHADILEEFFQPTWRNVIQKILGIGLDEQRAQRNRCAMLERVRDFWIKGVLEQSLHGAAMIELGLEERADAVEHPWDIVLQTPDQPNHPLPPGTKIADVFDEMSRALLILGEPGSGKTITLLELARDSIARADEDPTQPIPVVFNLSSWTSKEWQTDKGQSIFLAWLVDELNAKYNIPRRIARPWVENDDLLLLLDGLDEVRVELRETCVKAINVFRQQHGLTPLMVCSRIADYEELATRLKLQGAVFLQPLTSQQVDQYFEGAGIELLTVRRILQYDTRLQELARSPLILSIMTLAYRGMSVEDLQALGTTEAHRKHLFDTYVERMFKRRGADQRYSPEQTIYWLAWLAQKVSEHAQSIFLIERMQPNWLQAGAQVQLYITILGLVGGLVGALAGGLAAGLIGGLTGGLIGGLTGVRMMGRSNIEPFEVLIKWSWQEGKLGLIVGLIIGLIVGLSVGLSVGLTRGLIIGLIVGLRIGLFFGLLFGLLGGAFGAEVETTVPGQGIQHSAKNAIIVWLIAGLIGGMLAGLRVGLIAGLVLGLLFGGMTFIQHLILRFILYRNGYIPRNYADFLDYAAERILLRKVGGGYIFIHGLLLDYFAKLDLGQFR